MLSALARATPAGIRGYPARPAAPAAGEIVSLMPTCQAEPSWGLAPRWRRDRRRLQRTGEGEEVRRARLARGDRPVALLGGQPLLLAGAGALVPIGPVLAGQRVADVVERAVGLRDHVVGAVLVADDDDPGDAVIADWRLAVVVRLGEERVHPFKCHLRDARGLAQPRWDRHDEDLRREDAFADRGPLVAVGDGLGYDPEVDLVVGEADDVGLDAFVAQCVEHDLRERFRVGLLRGALEGADQAGGSHSGGRFLYQGRLSVPCTQGGAAWAPSLGRRHLSARSVVSRWACCGRGGG